MGIEFTFQETGNFLHASGETSQGKPYIFFVKYKAGGNDQDIQGAFRTVKDRIVRKVSKWADAYLNTKNKLTDENAKILNIKNFCSTYESIFDMAFVMEYTDLSDDSQRKCAGFVIGDVENHQNNLLQSNYFDCYIVGNRLLACSISAPTQKIHLVLPDMQSIDEKGIAQPFVLPTRVKTLKPDPSTSRSSNLSLGANSSNALSSQLTYGRYLFPVPCNTKKSSSNTSWGMLFCVAIVFFGSASIVGGIDYAKDHVMSRWLHDAFGEWAEDDAGQSVATGVFFTAAFAAVMGAVVALKQKVSSKPHGVRLGH